MEQILSSLGLDMYVLVAQILNILVVIVLFKKFVGDSIVREVANKKALIAKLEKADETYDAMIANAEKESEEILQKARKHKQKIVAEAQQSAEKVREEMMQAATEKAQQTIKEAERKASQMQKDLASDFEKAVKTVAKSAINKILSDKKELQDEYLTNIIKEIS